MVHVPKVIVCLVLSRIFLFFVAALAPVGNFASHSYIQWLFLLAIFLCVNRNTLREKLEARGREMLTNMQNTEGVITLDTGVAVHILEKGENSPGTRPTQGSVVLIHYHGTLSDGTVFDSTLGGDPVKFPLAQVIPGWRDGVLQMEQGDTAMLGIPPEQAYGPQGTPDGRIPGGSTLFFKIQLVEVLSNGVGGDPTLLGADGQKLGGGGDGPGLVGADGRPL